uniref:Uncharacterized protein n=1 Tax=Anguilla anguilla TaxID=7936 RepID=A0A0E9VRG4_ANGAN
MLLVCNTHRLYKIGAHCYLNAYTVNGMHVVFPLRTFIVILLMQNYYVKL